MKNGILLKLAFLISFFAANQAFGWTFGVTNWSNAPQDVEARYPGCRNDRTWIGIGHRANFDAKGCLLTEIALHSQSQVPYTSSGQSTYKEFYIIGPIDGIYRVGRIEHN